MKRGLLALSLLLLAACNGAPSEPAPASVTTTSVVVKPQVSWPAASSIDERALASLGDARSQLSRSPVPVLAPSSEVALEKPTVIVEAEYYVITARNRGATISVQGTRTAHRYEGVDPHPGNKKLRSGTGFVTVNEGIRSSSFIENGVAYTVDVECADHTDARCTSDAFVTELTNQLVYVGGGAAR